jgi:hypothetical protein
MEVKIKIKLGKKEIELTTEEAKELYDVLKKICGDDKISWYPVYPTWPLWPNSPIITYETTTTADINKAMIK